MEVGNISMQEFVIHEAVAEASLTKMTILPTRLK